VHQLDADLFILRVGESGFRSCIALDSHLESRNSELRGGLGDERDATLAGSRLPRDCDCMAIETLR
jgi:hypothetical protein